MARRNTGMNGNTGNGSHIPQPVQNQNGINQPTPTGRTVALVGKLGMLALLAFGIGGAAFVMISALGFDQGVQVLERRGSNEKIKRLELEAQKAEQAQAERLAKREQQAQEVEAAAALVSEAEATRRREQGVIINSDGSFDFDPKFKVTMPESKGWQVARLGTVSYFDGKDVLLFDANVFGDTAGSSLQEGTELSWRSDFKDLGYISHVFVERRATSAADLTQEEQKGIAVAVMSKRELSHYPVEADKLTVKRLKTPGREDKFGYSFSRTGKTKDGDCFSEYVNIHDSSTVQFSKIRLAGEKGSACPVYRAEFAPVAKADIKPGMSY
jgi:hypothetical protein